MAGRVPRVFVIQRVLHHGGGHGRQHGLDISADGRDHTPADERCGVLERPDEFVDLFHDVDGNGGCLPALGHQEDRNLVVAGAEELQESAGPLVVVVLAQGPVDQYGVDCGIRSDDRCAIFGGRRFDDFDRTVLEFPDQRAHRTTLGGRIAELVVHDEGAHAEPACFSLDHLDYS